MSTPRKHHYVPQVHIKKFEHQNGYSLFIKEENKIISKKLSDDIFAVKDLNSSLDEDGNIDHTSVEQTLSERWESKFNTHLNILISWITESIKHKEYSDNPIKDSLKFFFEYGLMGHFRVIRQNRKFNESIIEPLLDFEELFQDIDDLDNSNSELSKEELELGKLELKNFITLTTKFAQNLNDNLKYPVPLPTEIPMFVPEGLICDFIITISPPYYLPDCTSIILRSEETFEYQNRKMNKIISIGIPIKDNLYIQIKNKDFFPNETTEIHIIEEERTREINQHLMKNALNQILVSQDFTP